MMSSSMSEFKDHDYSVSSMQVTNYEDSEFMITAYKRKKVACDRYKKMLMKSEQDAHLTGQRLKMAEMEIEHMKKVMKKQDAKYKKYL